AVRLREFSRDRQSEACSGKFAVHADIGLNERFKNPLQVLLGDSNSGVANNEAQAAVGFVADGELDLALGRREFDRVDEEIVEDLPQPPQIAANFSADGGIVGDQSDAGVIGELPAVAHHNL